MIIKYNLGLSWLGSLKCSVPLFLSFGAFMLTQTRITTEIVDSKLGFIVFKMFGLNSNFENSPYSRGGGGVLVAIKLDFNPLPVITNVGNVEQVFVMHPLNVTCLLSDPCIYYFPLQFLSSNPVFLLSIIFKQP